MSGVKHHTRGFAFFTLGSMKLFWWWIAQRRGRDLKTSVIKL